MLRSAARPAVAAVTIVVVMLAVVLGGCSGTRGPQSANSSPQPTPTSPAPSVSIPPGSLTLADLDFTHGPVQAFSLPPSSVIQTRVDQPNVVTAVLASPDPAEVADYLQNSLPGEGFVVIGDQQTAQAVTLTFAGHGWQGVFTGAGRLSAITLRPN